MIHTCIAFHFFIFSGHFFMEQMTLEQGQCGNLSLLVHSHV